MRLPFEIATAMISAVRLLFCLLAAAFLLSCKTVKFREPDDDTQKAALPGTLGGIPSHRH